LTVVLLVLDAVLPGVVVVVWLVELLPVVCAMARVAPSARVHSNARDFFMDTLL